MFLSLFLIGQFQHLTFVKNCDSFLEGKEYEKESIKPFLTMEASP